MPLVRHLRRNAVGWVALFVALSGTSYAATRLPANSVGTTQLQKSAVTGAKVKNGSLRTADIATADLAKLAAQPGAAGLRGPAGERGTAGADGARGQAGEAGGTGLTGDTGPRGPSDGWHARVVGPVPIGTSNTTVTSFQLPAGDFLLQAKVRFAASGGSTPTFLDCVIYNALTNYDHSSATLASGEETTLSLLTRAQNTSTPSTFQLRCSETNATVIVNAYDAVLTAVQVGTLH